MKTESEYLVLAFYAFTMISEPSDEVKRFRKFLESLDVKGRIYINKDGINAQMSILKKNISLFNDWFLRDSRFKGTDIKIQYSSEHVFSKLTIKHRKQLVSMDRAFDLSKGGKHVSSEKWAEMIEQRDENTIILDVRNEYEWEVGHFEGSEKPHFQTFREFPQYVKKLRKIRNPKQTKVMMYCTGGIRCETYSCIFSEEGFEEVYQLDGGVIKYGQEQGCKYWKGKLFVFDDRLVIPITNKEPSETISYCKHCNKKSDSYYNCANMDCNVLFLSCFKCAKEMDGCCADQCMHAPRTRHFTSKQQQPKPFRKLPYKEKLKVAFSSL